MKERGTPQFKKPNKREITTTGPLSFKFKIATWERLQRHVAKGSWTWFIDAAINEKLDRELKI